MQRLQSVLVPFAKAAELRIVILTFKMTSFVHGRNRLSAHILFEMPVRLTAFSPNCRGSDLSEACAAGCAVVTGSNPNMYIHVADVNQAALRSTQMDSPTAEQGVLQKEEATQPENPRCQNPTPRHASG